MKKVLALGALLLAGTFAMSLAASAATMLTVKNGMTAYVFDKDAGGTPTWYNDCGGKMGEGWATVKRKDGSPRWTYDGKPFYFYFTDKK
jgi:predicted lipoprotein with Yx(FWY)xxD motif